MRKKLKIAAILLCFCLILSGCTQKASIMVNLTEGIEKSQVSSAKSDYLFTVSQYNSTAKILNELSKDGENFMFSPLSLGIACGIALNGAAGDTQQELIDFFFASIGTEKYNKYMKYFIDAQKNEIKNVSSIWYKNDSKLNVKEEFLQKSVDYYNADAFKLNFNNEGKDEINRWVKNATNGSIDGIIDEIDKDAMMFLINALTFEAQWHSPYSKDAVSKGVFKGENQQYTVDMMKSQEDLYIDYGGAKGFIKPYKNGEYLFVALLPDEDKTLSQYMASLDGDKLNNTINSAFEASVRATMPKFEFDYSFTADEILKKNGVNDAFDEKKADFTNMATVKNANLYIGEILQKTYISVTENGTTAGAVTKVEMAAKTSLPSDVKTVTVDRPFMFMIIDATTNIPVFAGAVNKF